MLAVQTNLVSLLGGNKQYIIPIYQRTYSWSDKQCRQLWNDIVRTALDEKISSHFIGSIVYISNSIYQSVITPQLLVIDGQQRITTLALLLIALRETTKLTDTGEITPALIDSFLINPHSQGDLRHKLVLTQSDKDTLSALIEGKSLPHAPSLRVASTFSFFKSQIQTSSLSVEQIFLGIRKLMLVDISLDRSQDNPQLIFESLNSTGLDLSQADLIRNFVLMGQEPSKQTDLYNDIWHPMEVSFAKGDAGLFDRFMRDYLTIKNGRIPNMDDVYVEFKSYVHTQSEHSIEEIVSDVHKYSRYFVALAFADVVDKAVRDAIENINRLRVDVAYPFLIESYIDFDNGILARAEFLKVLLLVESYVFRRAICDIPTNSLNKTFASLRKAINPSNYIESLEAALIGKDSYRRFPNDDEFRAQLTVKDVYNFRPRSYLLGKLENFGRKEIVDIEEYTIEHIMPQTDNLHASWLESLGPNWKHVHAAYLHTLGNLTLTAYNSEYSNRPFVDKRDLKDKHGNPCGFAHSPLHLNQGIGSLQEWNEEEILSRANALASKAVEIWPAPKLDEAILSKYVLQPTQVDNSDSRYETQAEKLFGTWFDLFDELRNRFTSYEGRFTEEYLSYAARFFIDGRYIIESFPQGTRIKLFLGTNYTNLDDPNGIACAAGTKHQADWAKDLTYSTLKTEAEIDRLMELVDQVVNQNQ